MPERIQISRQHPWRAQHPNAVIVDRTTELGNPYLTERVSCEEGNNGHCWQVRRRDSRAFQHFDTKPQAIDCAVEQYEIYVTHSPAPTAARIRLLIPELRGNDLACWCSIDQPCHADVLLKLANEPQ